MVLPAVETAAPVRYAAELARFRRVAELFDNAFRIPGTRWRFGLDAVLGLVPGLGDIAGALFALYGIGVARQVGAPLSVQVRMLVHIVVDVLAGTVPVLGDIFDIAFKAHVRNRKLLDRWLARPHVVARQSKAALIAVPVAALVILLGTFALSIWLFVALVRWVVGG
jgi:hypothetical protein